MPVYYGNPETLRLYNKNVAEVLQDDYDGQIEAWNETAQLELESELYQLLSSWPVANSTNQNIISTLWLMKMTQLIQQSEFAANTVASTSPWGSDIQSQYDALIEKIRNGSMVVVGASRENSTPSITSGGTKRFELEQEYTDPKVPSDNFPKGLRH